jgi:hypothetical protein
MTDAEREVLQQWARRPTSAQRLAQRARMALLCGDGLSNTQVAARVGVDAHNRAPRPFVWTASADLILEKVAKICKRTCDSGHWRMDKK